MKNKVRSYRRFFIETIFCSLLVLIGLQLFSGAGVLSSHAEVKIEKLPETVLRDTGPVVIASISGTINPASDDYLKTTLAEAEAQNARLYVLLLNTPGGLLPSMQSMVEQLLSSSIPTAVYVSPSGAGAISAGTFIAMAGNVAAMAPATTIGAAHPVMGGGKDVEGHMGEKVENFAATLSKAIAEQRGRNTEWAEEAVRKSATITEKEALEKNVIDVVVDDLEELLKVIEGREVEIGKKRYVLTDLASAPRTQIDMTFKQRVVNVLSDPNIAILLGLGAMVGLGIELYHPGALFPGIFGAICLVLSLTAAQVVPINYGGVGLLILAAVFFAVELFVPSFGLWGVAGIICLVLGSIYFVDSDMVWSVEGLTIDKSLIGTIAAICGVVLLAVCYLAINAQKRKVATGREAMLGMTAKTRSPIGPNTPGKVFVMGEIWNAELAEGEAEEIPAGAKVKIVKFGMGMTLVVENA